MWAFFVINIFWFKPENPTLNKIHLFDNTEKVYESISGPTFENVCSERPDDEVVFTTNMCQHMADGNVSQPKKNHHYILILSFEFVMWDDQLTRALTARKQPVILIYRYIRDAEIGNLIKVEKTEFICFRNIALHCHQV